MTKQDILFLFAIPIMIGLFMIKECREGTEKSDNFMACIKVEKQVEKCESLLK